MSDLPYDKSALETAINSVQHDLATQGAASNGNAVWLCAEATKALALLTALRASASQAEERVKEAVEKERWECANIADHTSGCEETRDRVAYRIRARSAGGR